MNSHKNAQLTALGRAELVHRVVDLGQPASQVVSKVEFHPGELFPRVGFIVTNRSLPNERVLAFYNDRGTAEQHIKEGKYALKWTRLSTPRAAAIVLAIKCGLKGKYFR